MKIWIRASLCLLLVWGASSLSLAQEKAPTQITITVPERGHEDTVVWINEGKEIKVEGTTYVYKADLSKGKEQKIKIKAMIQPNNYTKIYRIKEVKVKGGDIATVDMTTKNPAIADDIVVRFVPTPADIVDKMSEMAKVTKKDVVYDLGCGDAIMLIRPIQKFGAKKGVGIEIDPKIIELAKKNVKEAKLEEQVEIREGDMLKLKAADLADATVVLLYIGDDLGERLAPVLQAALKPGSRIVSHRFHLGSWTPTKSITTKGEDGYEYDLHLWVVGEKKK